MFVCLFVLTVHVCSIYDTHDLKREWKGNHLGVEHGATNLAPPRNYQDFGVNFTDPRSKASVGGHPVYAAYFAGSPTGGSSPGNFVGQGTFDNIESH